MRTARTDSPTKRKLLDAAQRLMRIQGYAATSVEEICEAAKLTKGSFFHYFESKEALGRELLQRFCASMETEAAQCRSMEPDPLKRVLAFVDGMIQAARAAGGGRACLLGTLAQELSDTHPGIRSVCAEGFARTAVLLERDLAAAKARYAPRSSVEPKSLAEHFTAVVQGSRLLARATRDPKVLERNLRHFRRYLESVFGR